MTNARGAPAESMTPLAEFIAFTLARTRRLAIDEILLRPAGQL
jgi:hypothetical protein